MQRGVHSHVRESTIPVQDQLDGSPYRGYVIAGFDDMQDSCLTISRIDNIDRVFVPGYRPCVTWLTAAEWIKDSPINTESLFIGRRNDSSAGLQIGIFSE